MNTTIENRLAKLESEIKFLRMQCLFIGCQETKGLFFLVDMSIMNRDILLESICNKIDKDNSLKESERESMKDSLHTFNDTVKCFIERDTHMLQVMFYHHCGEETIYLTPEDICQ